MVRLKNLFEIGLEHDYILIDNCILVNYINNFSGKKIENLDEIIRVERNYSQDLFDFIERRDNVYITSDIYKEFLRKIGIIKLNYANLSFQDNCPLFFRKNIALIQHNYIEIAKRLHLKLDPKLESNDFYKNRKKKIISEVRDFNLDISNADISLYALSLYFSKMGNSALITKDYDFLTLKRLDLFDDNNELNLDSDFNFKPRIFMPYKTKNYMLHNYRLMN